MKPEDFNVQELIQYLQGTCNTMDSAIRELYQGMSEDDLTKDDEVAIDNEIFLCEQCGWWYELSEQGVDEEGCFNQICESCVE